MEQLKLAGGQVFDLAINGIYETEQMAKFTVQPGLYTFEEIESMFTDSSNTNKIYVLNSLGETVRSIVGYTKYKGMEKVPDYVISTETVNQGTEEEPDYVENQTTGTVMIVKMSKPDVEDRVDTLETDMINTMLALTEIYEGSI